MILRYLLEHNAKPDDQNAEGNTPLHLALYEMREECAVILLKEAHCSIDLCNENHQTPLDLLNSEECGNTFSFLITSRIFPRSQNPNSSGIL